MKHTDTRYTCHANLSLPLLVLTFAHHKTLLCTQQNITLYTTNVYLYTAKTYFTQCKLHFQTQHTSNSVCIRQVRIHELCTHRAKTMMS